MRNLRNFVASLFLGFLFFITFLPSDVHAESCAVNGSPNFNVGDSMTLFVTDYANPNYWYDIVIVNVNAGARITIKTFVPASSTLSSGLPLDVVIPSWVSAGQYQLKLVALNFSGEWNCANGAVTIGSTPPPPPATNFLNVTSTGVSGVSITGSQPGTSNLTNYTIAISSDIRTTLIAPDPEPVSGRPFLSWSGCTSSGNQCFAVVTGGANYTVTANYAAATYPTPAYPTPTYPTPTYPTPAYPTPTYPTPASGSTCSVYADPNQPAQIGGIVCIIQRFIEILAPAAAIAFFFMVLMAAFRFIKSAGDPKKVANARDTLKYALLGVILVVAAWLILLLINQVTGAPVTTVSIP